jgi:hypothetical protein
MALVVEDGFETLLPAAEVLARYGKKAESADFIRRRIRAVPWDADAKLQLARTLSTGSLEWEQSLSAIVADTQAAYYLRAEAAGLGAHHSLGAPSGTELALLSSGRVTPDAAAKPFQVEARIQAARETTDLKVKLRLWREALAIAPADERVRAGTVDAALALRRDSLALAVHHAGELAAQHGYIPEPIYPNVRRRPAPSAQLTDAQRATQAEALAAAAERLDDPLAAQTHLRAAIELATGAHRAELERHLDGLVAEETRLALNALRQPTIKDGTEQDRVVRPQIFRSAK